MRRKNEEYNMTRLLAGCMHTKFKSVTNHKSARVQRTDSAVAESLVGLSILSLDSDPGHNDSLPSSLPSLLTDPIEVNRKETIDATIESTYQTGTTTTSSFRVSRARNRVSLADTSIATSDATSQIIKEACETLSIT